MVDDSPANKRKHPRISWGLIVKFKRLGQDTQISTVKDISEGGCAFNSGCEYVLEEVLELKIKFPVFRKPMLLKGQVKRCHPLEAGKLFSVAVAFQEMDMEKRKELQKALDFFIRKSRSIR
ncbi:MAG: PilZ domain-containing protein [Candidatus Omnitrophica bacterium]|nr:PilZ domain-containing protein [Candidatus Omnitrophota bacterium]